MRTDVQEIHCEYPSPADGFMITINQDLQSWSGQELTFGPFRLNPQQRVILRADAPLRLESYTSRIGPGYWATVGSAVSNVMPSTWACATRIQIGRASCRERV